MRYRELHEGRDAPLFHGCSFAGAVSILVLNEMKDWTRHKPRAGSLFKAEVVGVSLSRNMGIAQGFGPVVFELEQRLLVPRYRIVPVDYWSHAPDVKALGMRRKGTYAEAEEFVIGPIREVSRYLRAIHVDAVALERLKKQSEASWLSGQAAVLLQNPLLRVNGKPVPSGELVTPAP